jgi:hypothetical protein
MPSPAEGNPLARRESHQKFRKLLGVTFSPELLK